MCAHGHTLESNDLVGPHLPSSIMHKDKSDPTEVSTDSKQTAFKSERKLVSQDTSAGGGPPLTAVFKTFIMGSSQQTSYPTSLANWHASLQNPMI